MGGRGSGGRRVGAGRKSKGQLLAFTHGSRQRLGGSPPPAELPPPAPVDPPADLTADVRAVWDQLAAHALVRRTLTPDTLMSFVDACRVVAIRNAMHAKIDAEGWTYWQDTKSGEVLKKHPLVTDLKGWEQRVEAALARFMLAPFGKQAAEPAKPEDPFAEFEAHA
jgi:hypothetical protein